MSRSFAQLITWNFERRGPRTRQAKTLASRIAAFSPDVVCLTEAFDGSTAEWGGFEISARGLYWSKSQPSERKVVLWSRNPWTFVDNGKQVGLEQDAFVAARTTTPIGTLAVAGVCIPYRAATPYGSEVRSSPWNEHRRFLACLRRFVADRGREVPQVILGDFNQRLPRGRQPVEIAASLIETLGDFRVSTTGVLAVVDRPTIDHISLSRDLDVDEVAGIDERAENGKNLSDHFGVRARIMKSSNEH